MVNCASTKEASYDASRGAYEWYAKHAVNGAAEFSDWLEERSGRLGTYGYTDRMRAAAQSGRADVALTFDKMMGNNSVIAGDPDEVIERARQYGDAGVDELLCLFNPYDIPHENVMASIRLLGEHVLPALAD
jgi:alkanesulfonate monooxygenase SsuD/methylene tetrahydromethanopterin reductase-like flavin-dependent oxidoreductase (luciferase family)